MAKELAKAAEQIDQPIPANTSTELDCDCEHVLGEADRAFGQRDPLLLPLWQEMAEQFHPMRASFTLTPQWGRNFADHLTTSFPIQARQELADSFSSTMRPKNSEWFEIKADGREDDDLEAQAYLQRAEKIMRKAMYDQHSGFTDATRAVDNDFVTFGQGVISHELDLHNNRLLFRSWHLRDVAWAAGPNGLPNKIFRRWKPTASELTHEFENNKNATLHPKAAECLSNNQGDTKFTCYHIMYPARDWRRLNKLPYRDTAMTPWVSIWIDRDNKHKISEEYVMINKYTIPRWITLGDDGPYAHSPCTVAATPDARLLQGISLILLEAGEKMIDPTLIVREGAVKSPISLESATAMYVDKAYDATLGPPVEPIKFDKTGIQFGIHLRDSTREMIERAFMLNRINGLPPAGDPKMTAYETGQRIQEYIRQTLPLFEPAETNYSAPLCESVFELLMRVNAFGPRDQIPESLSDAEINFSFNSPLSHAIEEDKAQKYATAKALLTQAAASNPNVMFIMDDETATRDVLSGQRTPAKWLRSKDQVQAMSQQQAQAAQAQQAIANVSQAAQAAEQVGAAGQALQGIS